MPADTPEHIDDMWCLISRAQEGDGAALAEFYAHAAPLIRKYAYFRTGDPALADDLTGDTWVKAIRNLYRLKRVDGKSPVAWLTTILNNVLADHYKSGEVRRRVPCDELPDSVYPAPGPEDEALIADQRRRLLQMMRHLTPEQRTALDLRYLQHYSILEASRIMGINEGALKAVTYRGIANMRRMSQQEWGEGFTPRSPRQDVVSGAVR